MLKTLITEGLTEAEARDRALVQATHDYDQVEFVGITRASGRMWAVEVRFRPEVVMRP